MCLVVSLCVCLCVSVCLCVCLSLSLYTCRPAIVLGANELCNVLCALPVTTRPAQCRASPSKQMRQRAMCLWMHATGVYASTAPASYALQHRSTGHRIAHA
eukprot:3773624-Rhodomonas_salina.2